MKYLIDLSCPTDCYLFKGLAEELAKRGHEVHLVTRGYPGDQMNQLSAHLGLKPVSLGIHGGDTLYGKLAASAERTLLLATHIVHGIGLEDFKGVISNSNPETCRVGFGLGVNVYSWNDSPDLQVAQTRLTAPLSTWIFTPWIVPISDLSIDSKLTLVFRYRALYPMAWLPDIKTDPDILDKLELDPDKPVIAFRESETMAAYLGERDLAVEAVKALAEKHPDWQFAARPRYSRVELERKMGAIPSNVHVYADAIDLHSLLAKSSLFLGGGGTINIEAAYYGVPVISTRAKTTHYERYLVDEKMVKRVETVEDAVESAETRVELYQRGLRPNNKVLKDTKYPLEEIATILEE